MSYTTSGPVIVTLNNVSATTNPGTSNDETEGYTIQSRWTNVSTDTEYVCLDAATGAAVWKVTTAGGDVTGGATSVDSVPAIYSGTTGKVLKYTAKPILVAHIADGTDGELITWNAAGEAATVPVGTATHVLTSNGTGAAPTFQAPGKQLVFQQTYNPAVIDRWVIWSPGGPWQGSSLQSTSGGTAAVPTFASTWDDAAIHLPNAATIDKVYVHWGPVTAPSTSSDVEFMLVKYPLTDGQIAVGTVTNIANGTDTCATTVNRNLLELTINAGTINANDGLRFCFRGLTGADLAVNYFAHVTIEYS